MNTFFKNFPQVVYNENNVLDITQRTKLVDMLIDNPYIFYTYMIEGNQRSDQLANDLYQDPYLNWALYLSNQILDPYYGWYISENAFYELIQKKYGDLDTADKTIVNYRVNWFKDQSKLNRTQFETLGVHEKKYWEVTDGETSNPLWTRRKLDWEINTNVVVKYWISQPLNVQENDRVTIKLEPTSLGNASVITQGSTLAPDRFYILCQHVSGDYNEHSDINLNGQSFIKGPSDQATILSIEIIHENITSEEYKYWEPVSALQQEIEKNEFNKAVKILDPSLMPKMIQQLKSTLNAR